MSFHHFKTLVISVTIFLFGFIVAYDTICMLLKSNKYEIGMTMNQEDEKTEKEKEKEKEKETDDADELFFENYILALAGHVTILHYSSPFPCQDNLLISFPGDVVPPPPKA
jgi:hypothetical protein